eukprot:313052-Rhodomonas_salina.2
MTTENTIPDPGIWREASGIPASSRVHAARRRTLHHTYTPQKKTARRAASHTSDTHLSCSLLLSAAQQGAGNVDPHVSSALRIHNAFALFWGFSLRALLNLAAHKPNNTSLR